MNVGLVRKLDRSKDYLQIKDVNVIEVISEGLLLALVDIGMSAAFFCVRSLPKYMRSPKNQILVGVQLFS